MSDTDTRLRAYARMLSEKGPDLGLIAEGDRDRVWDRHILDSLRAVAAVRLEDRDAYDLGSGAGLPGLIVAIAMPRLRVRLVEARRRRVAWLELVVGELALENVEVVPGRVEDLATPVDLCFARAFASPDEAWRLAEPLLRPGGRLVYFAGRNESRESMTRIAKDVSFVEDPHLESSGPLAIIASQ